MRAHISAYIGLALVLVLSGLSFVWDAPALLMDEIIGQNKLVGAVVFVLLMFGATVVAPVTVLPLVPLLSPAFGPFLTALLSIIGWTLGAVVAFLIARYAGRPILARFVSLKTLDRYESYFGSDVRFVGIVVLRIVIPVDILSYALGLFSKVPLLEYTLATAIGVSYFAFVFSYLGSAAFAGNIYLFMGTITFSLLVLGLAAWYMIKKARKR